MSNIGQIRTFENNISTIDGAWLSGVKDGIPQGYEYIVKNQHIISAGFKATDGFESNTNYYAYIPMRMNALDINKDYIISVKLCNQYQNGEEIDENYVVLEKFTLKANNTNTYDIKKINFTAPAGFTTYNLLVFEILNKSSINDYLLFKEDADIVRLNNALDTIDAIKIGVQSKPGFSVVINGETLEVGKAGILETPDGYITTFLGIPDTKEKFIIDYKY